MTKPAPVRNRYAGHGGRYVTVGSEVFPADDEGMPLPHRADVPDVPAAAEEQPSAVADPEHKS